MAGLLRLRLAVFAGLGVSCGRLKFVECGESTPVLDAAGNPSGLVECEDGSINRVASRPQSGEHASGTCAEVTESELAQELGYVDDWACSEDADCEGTESCRGMFFDGFAACGCVATCTKDTDCSGREPCIDDDLLDAGWLGSVCQYGTCRTGADCEQTGECGVSTSIHALGAPTGCRTFDDECRLDDDCPGGACYPTDEGWKCDSLSGVGRPLVESTGNARLASLRSGGQWTRPTDGLRTAPPALAAWWRRQALGEHASVASFARVSLELMALGAPPVLLLAVQAAALDEVRHATDFFSLAAAVDNGPGPGPLALDGIVARTTPEAVLDALIDEACIAETLAVARAMADLDACRAPEVRSVLTRVVADETRHAALAWRTLGWMLTRWPHLRGRAQARFVRPRPMGPEDAPVGLEDWGVASAEARRQAVEAAWEGVVEPAVAVLRGAPASSPAPPFVDTSRFADVGKL